jgi:hypothetical protein
VDEGKAHKLLFFVAQQEACLMKIPSSVTSHTIAVWLLLGVFPTVVSADTLNIPMSFNGAITTSFYDNPPSSRVYNNLGVTALPFTANVNSLSNMTLNLSAPVGNKINVDLPAGKTGYFTVNLNYTGTLGVFDSTTPLLHSYQFLGLSGTAPTNTYDSVDIRNNGNQISLQASYSFSEPFSFTGWGANIAGPFSTSSGTMTYSDYGSGVSFSYLSPTVAEQFVAFQPIPEPPTWMLVSMALVPLFFRQLVSSAGLRTTRKT